MSEVTYKNNNDLIILIGPSGSGKTTIVKTIEANSLIDNQEVFSISTDELRGIISGDENNQSVSHQAFDSARILVHYLCRRQKNILIDATNLYPKSRKQWIEIGKKYQYNIRAIVVNTDKDTCIKQDSSRTRVVGVDVITKQFEKYVTPTLEEGFDSILTLQVIDGKMGILSSIDKDIQPVQSIPDVQSSNSELKLEG